MKNVLFAICFVAICLTSVYSISLAEEEIFRGRSITLRDFGSDDLGFLSLPDIPPKYGILLLHDEYGLDDRMKRRCDWIADRGNIALGLDLFNGHIAENREEARSLQNELREESALRAFNAALRLLDESPRLGAPKIIVVALGKQCSFTLKALRKHPQKVIGISWIEPQGSIDEELFRKNRLPIQIIYYRPSETISQIRKNLDSKRKNQTVLIRATASPINADEAWNRAFTFWLDCLNNKGKHKGFFGELFD